MNRPDNMQTYDPLDLKLGIKSSLPNVRSTLALAVALWECCDRPSELVYSQQQENDIVISEKVEQNLIDYMADVCDENSIDAETFINAINRNQLFKSQLEALIVAFELIWKMACVTFVDAGKPASAERTGGKRFPKKMSYSLNMDIIHAVISSREDAYKKVLMSWMGFDVQLSDTASESVLLTLFLALSENAVYKLRDDKKNVIFNLDSIYRKILETQDGVDVNGDDEAKGSLRILKSALSENMNPYLSYSSNGIATAKDTAQLDEYRKRVEMYIHLTTTKPEVRIVDDPGSEDFFVRQQEFERKNAGIHGTNVLLYGVPGCGKSWTIANEYCDDENYMERLVFHPDYMYSDFVGQILPVVTDGRVVYKFVPGPFTKILKKAYYDPGHEYFLIIEEINRGNAPAIFGEIFQLLDRLKEDGPIYPKGTSEYPITHENIAMEVFGMEMGVRIPSNLSIIGTMNTSDQNVFPLDTAFQRRWNLRLIPNSFEGHKFANDKILDTDVTWFGFCTIINDEILRRGNITSEEDKRLGAYFISQDDLIWDKSEDTLQKGTEEYYKVKHSNGSFAEKILKYLWDDAFKFSRPEVFARTIDNHDLNSLELLVNAFSIRRGNERFDVFSETLKDAIKSTIGKKAQISTSTASEPSAEQADFGNEDGNN